MSKRDPIITLLSRHPQAPACTIWVAKCRRVALRTSLPRPWQNVCCIPPFCATAGPQSSISKYKSPDFNASHTPNYTLSASLVLVPALPSQANIHTPDSDGPLSRPAIRAPSPSQVRATPGALPEKNASSVHRPVCGPTTRCARPRGRLASAMQMVRSSAAYCAGS